jgi:hypothetical protein
MAKAEPTLGCIVFFCGDFCLYQKKSFWGDRPDAQELLTSTIQHQ